MPEQFQVALVTVAVTLIVSLSTVYFTERLRRSREIAVADHAARQRLVGTLMGKKLLLAQLYVSRFEALILSDYHEARWKLAGAHTTSLDLEEARRWMHKSEDLALEVARSSEALFEAVALAKVLFCRSPELDNLASGVLDYRVPEVAEIPSSVQATQDLDVWKTEAVRQVRTLVEQHVSQPIAQLSQHLASELA